MPEHPSSDRIFVSYSRKDGAEFAAELREQLIADGLSVWQDLIALEGGRDWWSQIEQALRSKDLDHFVLVVTPGALASKVVRNEIRLARQEGKTVSPVRGPGLDNLGTLPRWFGHVYDLAIPEQRELFLRVLHGPSTQKRVPMMAPEPPDDFVPRPAEFNALKQRLLDAKGDAVGITAALRGAGGYGKTTLARALAHDPDIQNAYFDGILWVELGEKPDNLLAIVSDLITTLTGTPPQFETVNAAGAALGEALGDRRILLVVDDLWREQDLRPFLHGGPGTTRLITTRNDDVLPNKAIRQRVDQMEKGQAQQLLSSGLPDDQVAALQHEIAALATRLGDWAQLLRIINGFLRDRVVKNRQPLASAVAGVNERLTVRGLGAFDATNETERTRTIAHTIQVSLDLIDNRGKVRFGELGVFPEDIDIPVGVIALLWKETGGLAAYEAEDLLSRLAGISLLQSLDLDQGVTRLHDNIRYFLREQAGAHGLIQQHRSLIRALEEFRDSVEMDAAVRLYYEYRYLSYHLAAAGQRDKLDALLLNPAWLQGKLAAMVGHYYYLYLPHHLAAAGDRAKLDGLLLDPAWLQAKLDATHNPQTLVADYEQHGAGETQSLIGRTLRLTSGICARDPRQLLPQLLGRLMRCLNSQSAAFLAVARRLVRPPAILCQDGSLTPPGAEIARLEGISHAVAALCALPDGRLASGSWGNAIQLWDLKSGAEIARLEGHLGSVHALCMVADGRLASGSSDQTIRVWDVKTGAEVARLEGHPVTSLCALPDGRIASGSHDNTIRLWDLNVGAESARLEGHKKAVTALCVLADGRLASGDDDTIRLWDVKAGAESARLEGHLGSVTALCALPDGSLASGSTDKTIRLWDVNIGAESARLETPYLVEALCMLADGRLASILLEQSIRLWDVKAGAGSARLEGHSDYVTALCALPDGRLVSGSHDKTIRLWDVNVAAERARVKGHSGSISALCVLADGRLASGSDDDTIRLWDVNVRAESARLEGHWDSVTALCALPDGRLASASEDSTIRLWDVNAPAESARLEGHSYSVTALCALPDGRLASGSEDETVRLWGVNVGDESVLLDEHAWVTALCVLTDGRLASGSWDGMIRLWDVKAGAEVACLEEQAGSVTAMCVLADGRLASGSDKNTIRLWDVKTETESGSLEGHSGSVTALCVLVDGRLASASWDNTIRLWNPVTGREIARLEVDAPVESLTVLRDGGLVAGDRSGQLHWLEIVD
jgi:WD40 repeat protein